MSDPFPAPVGLRVEPVAVAGSSVSLALTNTAPTAQCPGCGVPSARVHSRYTRRPADLPGHGRATRLLITIRRFFCPTEGCPRRTFAERLPGLVAPHARSTIRLDEAHAAIGHALGGSPGHGSRPSWRCRPAPTRSCGGYAGMPPGRLPRPAPWASTTSPSGRAPATARSLSTSSAVASSTCSPTAKRRPSPHGSAPARASRWSPATALPRTPRRPGRPLLTPCRSPTAGTS